MKYHYELIIRLFLAIIIPFNLLVYLFKPLTIYPIYYILSLLEYNPTIGFDSIFVNNISLIFSEACIAVSAYYLLILLILFTKDLEFRKRIYCFFIGSLLILLMNLIRVFILSILVINYNKVWFDLIHMFFWYIVSGVYVALVWILLVYIFKIKSIPIYSDLVYLYNKSILKNKFINNKINNKK